MCRPRPSSPGAGGSNKPHTGLEAWGLEAFGFQNQMWIPSTRVGGGEMGVRWGWELMASQPQLLKGCYRSTGDQSLAVCERLAERRGATRVREIQRALEHHAHQQITGPRGRDQEHCQTPTPPTCPRSRAVSLGMWL